MFQGQSEAILLLGGKMAGKTDVLGRAPGKDGSPMRYTAGVGGFRTVHLTQEIHHLRRIGLIFLDIT